MRRLISILNIMIERRQKWDASRYALSPADRRSTSTTQLLLAIHQSARAARGKARQGVEILLLSAINLVRVNGAPLRQFRHRRYLAQGLQGYFGLECGIKLLA
jgi:hypothetical protein